MINLVSNANVLINSFLEARKNSSFKNSVQQYEINLLRNVRRTQKELCSGTYCQDVFYNFFLNERGKERYVRSICIYDRVIQRALCDQLCKIVNPLLIYDNGASVKNKGIHFTRRRVETHLHKYYRRYGCDGYALLIDFKKFYDNIEHDKLIDMYRGLVDNNTLLLIEHLIRSFKMDISNYDIKDGEPFDSLDYAKSKCIKDGTKYLNKSLGIGSQISQISALYYPHKIDNYCKIVKGIKYYGRYMDDTYIISNSKEELKSILNDIEIIANGLGIFINKKKTHIFKLNKGFTFLKIRYRLTNSGHVIKKYDKGNIVRERRNLKRFKEFYDKGEMKLKDIERQYKAWRGNILKCNSYYAIQNMDKLYNSLFKNQKENCDL